jgi:hypothetical protein
MVDDDEDEDDVDEAGGEAADLSGDKGEGASSSGGRRRGRGKRVGGVAADDGLMRAVKDSATALQTSADAQKLAAQGTLVMMQTMQQQMQASMQIQQQLMLQMMGGQFQGGPSRSYGGYGGVGPFAAGSARPYPDTQRGPSGSGSQGWQRPNFLN